MNKTKKRFIALLFIISLFHILPFYLLTTTSFKAVDDVSSKWAFPGYWYIDNFINVWHGANLGQAFFNNIIITVVSVVLTIIIGAFAAYPLARYKSRLNRFMYTLFISVLIVPPLTILVPLYKMFVDVGAMNSYWGIILLHVTFHLPLTIFLYTGFIGTIPRELDEAAMIDGCTRVGLFLRIIMPLLKPVTATVVILIGVGIWNDYQFSVFFLSAPESRTITVSLSSFFGQYTNNIGWVAAGSLTAVLPITIAYLFLQRYFITGLNAGSVKG
ncbi:carbohydrate ABC transporter permease [Neobacillus sp. MER 74]|uniref:carbohydrate ABC transporter permease n=1 Tax=Neobacillus sp. MER 74 TaxID=2939566 RepID=UPI002041D08B|nr:carbohydrate ABC transporter permease [Neobacillus sp. MER 74]MCM3115364.1 carbohydrate ABC transporter permease [Neobacillus sp. MER 74]